MFCISNIWIENGLSVNHAVRRDESSNGMSGRMKQKTTTARRLTRKETGKATRPVPVLDERYRVQSVDVRSISWNWSPTRDAMARA